MSYYFTNPIYSNSIDLAIFSIKDILPRVTGASGSKLAENANTLRKH